jgi:hypothetical protein
MKLKISKQGAESILSNSKSINVRGNKVLMILCAWCKRNYQIFGNGLCDRCAGKYHSKNKLT